MLMGSALARDGSDLEPGKLLAASHRSHPCSPSPATKTRPHKPKTPLDVTYLVMALSSCLNNSEARPNLSQGTKRTAAGWKVTGGLGWILGLNLVLLEPVVVYYSLAKWEWWNGVNAVNGWKAFAELSSSWNTEG